MPTSCLDGILKKPSLFHSFEEPADSRQFHHDLSHSNTISHYQLRNSLQFFVAHISVLWLNPLDIRSLPDN